MHQYFNIEKIMSAKVKTKVAAKKVNVKAKLMTKMFRIKQLSKLESLNQNQSHNKQLKKAVEMQIMLQKRVQRKRKTRIRL
jgi:hypothetical protein